MCSKEMKEMKVLFQKATNEIKHYSPLQLVEILSAECDCARRSFTKLPEDSRNGSQEGNELRSTLKDSVKLLEEVKDESGARHLRGYWAEIEAFLFSDLDEAIKLWDSVLKGCQDLSLWCSVVDALRSCRRVGQARSFFKRGLNTLQSAPELASLCYRWLEFERREGDLETYGQARAKYATFAVTNPQVAVDDKVGRVAKKSREKKSDDPERAKRREEVMKKWAERKENSSKVEKKAPASKKRKQAEDSKDQESEEKAKRQKVDGGGQQPEQASSGESNLNTVFMQNLPHDAKDEDIKELFAQCCDGGKSLEEEIAAIRIVMDKHGSSKGFAYVDFKTEQAAKIALEKDGTEMKGRRVEVSKARELHSLNEQRDVDQRVLYVSGLSKNVSKESIKDHFSTVAEVLEVRLMRDRDGNLRGFCYVEFKDRAGAELSLQMDQTVFQGKKLRVAFSDPSRGRAASSKAANSGSAAPSAPRSSLNLVPRAVKRPQEPARPARRIQQAAHQPVPKPTEPSPSAPAEKAEDAASAAPKKDNDYFRQMFSKGANL
uniref:RRM domain-containing protein n=1 Tax=Guillardia theta TaxID=55529 RepID=A0A7S4KTS9_GUITH|mmetsp:Transcript_30483/g.98254  ORF Transcript_30483/g.98254 Transcript_30483/m.98254 type:complete len:547 (+) Transcript_30483:43-1683(+)